jgi:predicted transcriptional regulator
MRNEVLHYTSEIVSAYISRVPIRADLMPMLIKTVSEALAEVGRGEEIQQTAAVELPLGLRVENLVQPNQVVCAACGFTGRTLTRHIKAIHDLTPALYREKYGLKADMPLTAPGYSEVRSQLALQNGLGKRGRGWKS